MHKHQLSIIAACVTTVILSQSVSAKMPADAIRLSLMESDSANNLCASSATDQLQKLANSYGMTPQEFVSNINLLSRTDLTLAATQTSQPTAVAKTFNVTNVEVATLKQKFISLCCKKLINTDLSQIQACDHCTCVLMKKT